MSTTEYGDISPRSAGKIARKLLKRGQYMVMLERFGQVDPQPKKSTKVRKFRRYESLQKAVAPLAEGIPPSGQKLTYTDIDATLEQYGDWVELTDVIVDVHEDPVIDETITLCSEQISDTVETIRFNVLKAGTNVYYANNVASRSLVNSPLTKGDLRRVYRAFKRNKAREISQIISATEKIATEPVAPAFFALHHTDCTADVRNLSGFVSIEKYSDSMKSLPGEIGKVDDFRFLANALYSSWETSGLTGTTYLSGGATVTSTAQCDVYPVLIIAKDAYGIVPLQGQNAVKPMVVQPKPVQGDPLGQKGFVSWKMMQTAVILNQNWLARAEVAATADLTD